MLFEPGLFLAVRCFVICHPGTRLEMAGANEVAEVQRDESLNRIGSIDRYAPK
jgi:hypothetical protein